MNHPDRPATETFTLGGRIRSVQHAFRGIGVMLRTQHNAWIHALATILVIAMGVYFGVSVDGWCWLVLAIVSVWTAEALNTSLELLADVASPDFHPLVAKAKDVAAGAVLLAALGAVAIGVLVFGPYLREWIGQVPRGELAPSASGSTAANAGGRGYGECGGLRLSEAR